MNDAVGQQAAAFVPYLLFVFGSEAQFAEIGEGDGPTELVIVLTAVQSVLDIAPERRFVDVVQQIQGTNDIIKLPQSAFGLVLTRKGTELADNDTLGGGFESQRKQDAQNIIPFIQDELGVDFTDGLNYLSLEFNGK
jgi:hypothetical protein